MEKRGLSFLQIAAFVIPVVMILVGFLFTNMHWPYGQPLLMVGSNALLVFQSIWFSMQKKKTSTDYLKLFFTVTWCLGMFFLLQHWPYGFLIRTISIISFFALVMMYVFGDHLEPKKEKGGSVLFSLLQIASAMLILAGIFFKIMHWPYGTYLLIIGFVSLFVCFVFDWISEEKE